MEKLSLGKDGKEIHRNIYKMIYSRKKATKIYIVEFGKILFYSE